MPYQVDKLVSIDLGKQGENLARTIEIDVSSMLSEWPNATFGILVQRKGDIEPYISNCSRSDNLVYWPITSAETEKAGIGRMELRCTNGDVIAKSYVATIRIAESINGEITETPEPSRSWIDDVLSAADKVQTTADEVQAIADEVQTTADDIQALRAELVTVRDNANTAADNANTAASKAQTAADNANTAANSASAAAEAATSAADNANEAAEAANTAASEANTAADNANEAAEAVNLLGLTIVDGKLCVEVERE